MVDKGFKLHHLKLPFIKSHIAFLIKDIFDTNFVEQSIDCTDITDSFILYQSKNKIFFNHSLNSFFDTILNDIVRERVNWFSINVQKKITDFDLNLFIKKSLYDRKQLNQKFHGFAFDKKIQIDGNSF